MDGNSIHPNLFFLFCLNTYCMRLGKFIKDQSHVVSEFDEETVNIRTYFLSDADKLFLLSRTHLCQKDATATIHQCLCKVP